MSDGRLAGKVALVCGAGQTPGATMGNGRATALRFAQEGALVAAADLNLESAEETAAMVRAEGGRAVGLPLDVADEGSVQEVVAATTAEFGRLDVLHNNVGVSVVAGDADLMDIEHEALHRILAINLEGMALTCRTALRVMRGQGSGSITNVSSIAVHFDYALIGYRTSKAAVITLTESVAIRNAAYGIRANVIVPGLIETPTAIDSRVARGADREQLRAERNARVPLKGGMGSAWDVANAALFLHSDEAKFVTGAKLTVDGGHSLALT
ncbi:MULTISPECIES: SDR family NAD(P)-dependent oxidoreductase [unclassified Pseudonocardia]|uniref:SDR family NAD(P)-dependent oxidoreductase n=1 Tax=unclassified Pseudonocardia TaxID=2619320 RepID=UPI0004927266|nr:SDR family NAD(P)-dependent oxidoreductase [Pseudonocardia sp. Ae707_Ps1]OLM18241.1 3-oxoacyl-[acyl-carrier protein] reductase [Pseudonocardia sp. Ae707_Ps1]